MLRPGFLVVAVLATLLTGCVTELSPVTGERQSYGYSWAQELELGKQADADIVRQFGVYDDPERQSYVEQVALTVLSHSDFRAADTPEQYRNTAFTFRVLDSPVVNAMALPGGYVYVTRGLLAHVNDEAQLAVVLGHEIAHVAARHASRQALRAQFSQLGLVAGAIIGQQALGQPGVAENILQLGGSGVQLLLMKYGREAEREADRLGAAYAAGERYAVPSAAGFFGALDRLSQDRPAIPTWQSTHPDPGERAQKMRRYKSPQGVPLNVVGRERYLQKIDGLVVGDDPRQGYTDKGQYFHPELGFQFSIPQGWQLINQRAAVFVVQEDQQAIMRLTLVKESSPSEAALAFAQSDGLQIDERRSVKLASLGAGDAEAERVLARAQTQQGVVIVDNYFFRYRNNTYSFLGYSPEAHFRAHSDSVNRSILSFSPLTDSARLDVQPKRLRITEVKQATPFQAIAASSVSADFDLDDMAVLNQVSHQQLIQARQQIKLVD